MRMVWGTSSRRCPPATSPRGTGQGLDWMTHIHFVPEHGDVILTNSQRSCPFIARILRDWSRWGVRPGRDEPDRARASRDANDPGADPAHLAVVRLADRPWGARGRSTGLVPGRGRARGSKRGGHHILALLGVLLWSVSQAYLFTSSVFPDSSVWLGASLLLLSSCCWRPRYDRSFGGSHAWATTAGSRLVVTTRPLHPPAAVGSGEPRAAGSRHETRTSASTRDPRRSLRARVPTEAGASVPARDPPSRRAG